MTTNPLPPRPAADATEILRLDDGRRLHGFVDDGYGAVVDAFVANYRERQDHGSGCTVYVDGRLVVDLWGGTADSRVARPWHRDTAAVIFSCSKGLLALMAYLLVQDGRLDLDAPIARYWPEFGGHGKGELTVRQALSHRAGLPALDRDLTRADVLAWGPVIDAIEAQASLYPPEAGHAYHALTHGWIVGEVLRRITGRMPGQLFDDVVARPLGLDTWIGLPDAARPQVAFMEPPLPDEDSDDARLNARLFEDNPTVRRSLTMGGAFDFPAKDGYVTFNDVDIQRAEIPAANGISTAESLARLYAACVFGAETSPLLTAASVVDALQVQAAGPQLTGAPDDGARWGTGFQLSSAPSQPMLGPTSFGHAGAGGQLAFADAESAVGFAYLSNQMGGYGDRRARALTTALAECLQVDADP